MKVDVYLPGGIKIPGEECKVVEEGEEEMRVEIPLAAFTDAALGSQAMNVNVYLPGGIRIPNEKCIVSEGKEGIRIEVPMVPLMETLAAFFGKMSVLFAEEEEEGD